MQTESCYLFILFDVTKCLFCLFTKDMAFTLERVREILIQAEPSLLKSIGIVFKSVASKLIIIPVSLIIIHVNQHQLYKHKSEFSHPFRRSSVGQHIVCRPKADRCNNCSPT